MPTCRYDADSLESDTWPGTFKFIENGAARVSAHNTSMYGCCSEAQEQVGVSWRMEERDGVGS